MDHNTSSGALVVRVIKVASLRAQPTRDDQHNSDIIRIIMIGNEKQLGRMFRVSCHVLSIVLEAVLE